MWETAVQELECQEAGCYHSFSVLWFFRFINNAVVDISVFIFPKYARVPGGLCSNMNEASECVAFRFISLWQGYWMASCSVESPVPSLLRPDVPTGPTHSLH